jgi:hypothetical protein
VACRSNAIDVGPDVAVAVLDLSDGGARLRVRGALRLGLAVSLTLEGTYNGQTVRRTARVRWCGPPAADGTCVVGFAFESPVPYRELIHFVRM